jgi:hypothetical protein
LENEAHIPPIELYLENTIIESTERMELKNELLMTPARLSEEDCGLRGGASASHALCLAKLIAQGQRMR